MREFCCHSCGQPVMLNGIPVKAQVKLPVRVKH